MQSTGIQNFSLLRGATQAQMKAFRDVCERIELAPGELLIREGDEADALFLLLEGEVEVLKFDGNEHQRIGVYTAGVSMGHWGWVRRERRTATVRALDGRRLGRRGRRLRPRGRLPADPQAARRRQSRPARVRSRSCGDG